MLKKVMDMVASKYIAIKVRIRAIETHLMIQSLLLQDKKMIRHLFRQRKHFNLVSNKVKDEDEDEDEDYQSESPDAFRNGSVATIPLIHSSVATTPVGIVQVAEEDEDKNVMDDDDDDDDDDGDGDCMDSRRSVLGDEGKENECVSVIEMVKNAKEGRGKKFILEEDIDKVADLFIQRFHHQIRLQKRLSEED